MKHTWVLSYSTAKMNAMQIWICYSTAIAERVVLALKVVSKELHVYWSTPSSPCSH